MPDQNYLYSTLSSKQLLLHCYFIILFTSIWLR